MTFLYGWLYSRESNPQISYAALKGRDHTWLGQRAHRLYGKFNLCEVIESPSTLYYEFNTVHIVICTRELRYDASLFLESLSMQMH